MRKTPGFLSGRFRDFARPQAPRADAKAADAAVDQRADALEIRLEAPSSDVVGVADDAPDYRRLAAHFTLLRHVNPLSDPISVAETSKYNRRTQLGISPIEYDWPSE